MARSNLLRVLTPIPGPRSQTVLVPGRTRRIDDAEVRARLLDREAVLSDDEVPAEQVNVDELIADALATADSTDRAVSAPLMTTEAAADNRSGVAPIPSDHRHPLQGIDAREVNRHIARHQRRQLFARAVPSLTIALLGAALGYAVHRGSAAPATAVATATREPVAATSAMPTHSTAVTDVAPPAVVTAPTPTPTVQTTTSPTPTPAPSSTARKVATRMPRLSDW